MTVHCGQPVSEALDSDEVQYLISGPNAAHSVNFISDIVVLLRYVSRLMRGLLRASLFLLTCRGGPAGGTGWIRRRGRSSALQQTLCLPSLLNATPNAFLARTASGLQP